MSYDSFEHRFVPVVAALAPPGLRLLIAVAYYGATARSLAAEEFDFDDVAFPLEFAHSGEAVRHVFEECVDVGVCVQSCPRQEQVASKSAGRLYQLRSGLIVEVRLQHAFEDLGPEEAHKELALTSLFVGHSVRQFLGHFLCSIQVRVELRKQRPRPMRFDGENTEGIINGSNCVKITYVFLSLLKVDEDRLLALMQAITEIAHCRSIFN